MILSRLRNAIRELLPAARDGWRSFLVIVLALAVAQTIRAHPSASVVMTANGEVFFSDLQRIWVIRVGGTVELALARVHTHELWLDEDGSVLGEDVANEGENYRHRVFRIRLDGSVDDAVDWRRGYPRDEPVYPVTEAAGGYRWALGLDGTVRRFHASGDRMRELRVTPPARWITAHPSGALVTRESDIWLLAPDGGRITRIQPDTSPTESFEWVGSHHALMKLWVGERGEFFVPVFAAQRTDHFDVEGASIGSLPSPEGWSPTGGLRDSNGSTWILEWSADGRRCRVRRITIDGAEAIFAPT